MSSVSVNGIVVRYANYRESDRILTLLTFEKGKLTVAARGARRPNSRLLPLSEIFSAGTFELFDYHDRYTLDDGVLADNYFDLRMDMERLACAIWTAGLAEAGMNEEEPAPELYALLLRTIARLCYGEQDAPGDVAMTFAWQMLSLLGYRPVTDRCVCCGADHTERPFFDLEAGGTCCKGCGTYKIRLWPGERELLDRVLFASLDSAGPVFYNSKGKRELHALTDAYLNARLERPFEAMEELLNKWGMSPDNLWGKG